MSALETLWLWLQGRSSRTEAGSEAFEAPRDRNQDGPPSVPVDPDDAARIQRNWRYRSGPWQMK